MGEDAIGLCLAGIEDQLAALAALALVFRLVGAGLRATGHAHDGPAVEYLGVELADKIADLGVDLVRLRDELAAGRDRG